MLKLVSRFRLLRPVHLVVLAASIALTATAFVLALSAAPPAKPAAKPLVYSDLVRAMDAKQVQSAKVDVVKGRATVTLAGGRTADIRVPPDLKNLPERLTAAGARVTVARRSGIPAPIAFLLISSMALAIFLVVRQERRRRSGQLGAMDLRGSSRLADDDRPVVRFSDVAGCGEAVEEVSEFVEFLREPERFSRLGASMPSGVVLYGPPGTGKTLLAKALAGEAGCAFFAVSGSDFVEQFVGVGAKRVRELFGRARDCEDGAVIFIDEIDAVGKRRGGGGAPGNDEREGTLNELLVQMDGFDSDRRVVVVAATNRLDTLDPALLRPGRLARQVRVDLPSEDGRLEILGVHAKGKPLDDDVSLEQLARITAGSSGADLADMLNEAAIMAARARRDLITQADLEEGHLRALAGPEKRSNSLSDDEKQTVAAHESGHVLAAELCATADKAQRTTIRPRGRAAGLAIYGRTDRALHDPRYIHEQLVCILGGRAAEWVTFGRVTSGAANDLQQANSIARQAVQELGFSPHAGQMVASSGGEALNVSENVRASMDAEVERLVSEAYREAIALLSEHRVQLELLTSALLIGEDLDRAEILAALGGPLAPRKTTPGFGELAGRAPEPVLAPVPVPAEPSFVLDLAARGAADRDRRAPRPRRRERLVAAAWDRFTAARAPKRERT